MILTKMVTQKYLVILQLLRKYLVLLDHGVPDPMKQRGIEAQRLGMKKMTYNKRIQATAKSAAPDAYR